MRKYGNTNRGKEMVITCDLFINGGVSCQVGFGWVSLGFPGFSRVSVVFGGFWVSITVTSISSKKSWLQLC